MRSPISEEVRLPGEVKSRGFESVYRHRQGVIIAAERLAATLEGTQRRDQRKRRSQATGAAIAIDDPVGSAHCERLRWWELVTR